MKISIAIVALLLSVSLGFAQSNSGKTLPALFKTSTVKNSTSLKDWESKRRPELLQLFEENVYGPILGKELNVSFTVVSESPALNGAAIEKDIRILYTNGTDALVQYLLLFTPANAQTPVPVFLGMNFYGNHTIVYDTTILLNPNYLNNKPEFMIFDHKATHESRGVRNYRWPIERMLERGYGLATFYYGDLDPDYDDGFQNGIHKLLKNNALNNSADFGSISAWSLGLIRALNYLQTDPHVANDKIAVIGHSRMGKAALWAGANDERFAMVISNNSGCGGAALSMRKQGETIEEINTRFPHWFNEKFNTYNGKEEELPLDQHMLLALIAPRPLYIGSAEEDEWADPEGEYLSLYHSAPAYHLYEPTEFKTQDLPPLNTPLINGKVGYHIRSGTHDITKFDWEKYMDFADELIK